MESERGQAEGKNSKEGEHISWHLKTCFSESWFCTHVLENVTKRTDPVITPSYRTSETSCSFRY